MIYNHIIYDKSPIWLLYVKGESENIIFQSNRRDLQLGYRLLCPAHLQESWFFISALRLSHRGQFQ